MSRVPVWWSMIPTTMKSARLERGMGDEEHPAGGRGVGRARTEQDHHQAELAHRAEREEQLQVVLTESAQAAEQQGGAAHREDQRPPEAAASANAGAKRPIRYTPAVTMVAECR